jgi:hypothetical protein
MSSNILKRSEALKVAGADGLPLSDTTLDNLAARGEGPPYTYARQKGDRGARAVYTEAELLEWVKAEKARRGIK